MQLDWINKKMVDKLIRLEEAIFLMTPKTKKLHSELLKISATPRVLFLTILQTIALVVVSRISWLIYKSKNPTQSQINLHKDDVEEWMKDNPHIEGGFRQEMPLAGCICSCGSLHNETVNIWSHFFGFLYFANAFVFARRRHARWQVLVATYLLGISTLAHSTVAYGPLTSKYLFRLDRASIAIYFYSISLFVAKAHFHHESRSLELVCKFFQTIVSFAAVFVLGGLSVPVWASTSILATQMAFGSLPVIREYLITPDEYIKKIVIKYLALCSLFGTGGGVVFSTRFPERFLGKGKCDKCGNSHNLMHVLVGMAIFFAYRGSYLWELHLQRQGKPLA